MEEEPKSKTLRPQPHHPALSPEFPHDFLSPDYVSPYPFGSKEDKHLALKQLIKLNDSRKADLDKMAREKNKKVVW